LAADRCTPGTSAVNMKEKASSVTSTASGMSASASGCASSGPAPLPAPCVRLHKQRHP
jgi:hypothetical protein